MPTRPPQIVKHGRSWHYVDPETMRTTCCDVALKRIDTVASEFPVDEPRCKWARP